MMKRRRNKFFTDRPLENTLQAASILVHRRPCLSAIHPDLTHRFERNRPKLNRGRVTVKQLDVADNELVGFDLICLDAIFHVPDLSKLPEHRQHFDY